jgi:hypothetical protein
MLRHQHYHPVNHPSRATSVAPTLVAHADWSVDAGKRWMCVARRDGNSYLLGAPEPVGPVSTLLARLLARAAGGPAVLGVDLPLGLPRAYARTLPAADFPGFLRGLAAQDPFFQVCAGLDELSIGRPFYPMRGASGMTRAAHAAALGFAVPSELSRLCDRATIDRPAGAPLFWTLGANQTGKAALSAWRDCLIPALAAAVQPLLWPFDGDLLELLHPGRIVLAETYPAEAMRHLGIRLSGTKRDQTHRASASAALFDAMDRLGTHPGAAMHKAVTQGFGADSAGEDRLDCVLGVLCVINVLRGHRPDGIPPDPWLRRWEGWVLGQTSLPVTKLPSAARDAASG